MDGTKRVDRATFRGPGGARMDMEEGELVVDFEGREVADGFDELDELVLALRPPPWTRARPRSTTAVVIPLTTQHYPVLQRNLVYTAVTRGKLVVLVGQPKALAIALREQQTRRRWSKLKEWLAPAVS